MQMLTLNKIQLPLPKAEAFTVLEAQAAMVWY